MFFYKLHKKRIWSHRIFRDPVRTASSGAAASATRPLA